MLGKFEPGLVKLVWYDVLVAPRTTVLDCKVIAPRVGLACSVMATVVEYTTAPFTLSCSKNVAGPGANVPDPVIGILLIFSEPASVKTPVGNTPLPAPQSITAPPAACCDVPWLTKPCSTTVERLAPGFFTTAA